MIATVQEARTQLGHFMTLTLASILNIPVIHANNFELGRRRTMPHLPKTRRPCAPLPSATCGKAHTTAHLAVREF